ncbi:uncharacterized protein Dsimw501_GD27380, isoform B [Drosophila simulans]|uniref:Uncharacterized protein, isoform B n=1 Tax=Drosophila simulans TaxID=7240 RepID=A0A0J9RI81_DROSI|nr:uncharacterized protein Dsimw501_GD27380, isoform B [Drosophila simulans]
MKKEITTEVTRVDKCILQQCATGCNNATSIAPSGPREVRQPKEANGSIETKQSGERTLMGATLKGRFNWIDIKLAEGQNLLGPTERREFIKIFYKERYTEFTEIQILVVG